MKRILLLITLFATVGINAQATHMINWFMGVPSSQTSITINEGDIVTWTWQDNLPHTVTSVSGMETFNSGSKTGMGQTFSYTFDEEGTTSYQCNVHPMMQGVITVEAALGVGDVLTDSFKYYPNPVNDVFTITPQDNIDKVEVYDINGRLLMSSAAPNPVVKIYMDKFNEGTYYVKATIGAEIKNVAVIKQ